MSVIADVTAKATYHVGGAVGRSTTRQTVSVTEAKSWSPVTSRARCSGSFVVLSSSVATLIRYISSTGHKWPG